MAGTGEVDGIGQPEAVTRVRTSDSAQVFLESNKVTKNKTCYAPLSRILLGKVDPPFVVITKLLPQAHPWGSGESHKGEVWKLN